VKKRAKAKNKKSEEYILRLNHKKRERVFFMITMMQVGGG
jgi:hypothetical protein